MKIFRYENVSYADEHDIQTAFQYWAEKHEVYNHRTFLLTLIGSAASFLLPLIVILFIYSVLPCFHNYYLMYK